MKQSVITGLFLLLSVLGFPQKEFDNWYFGRFCGVTFKNGAPVFLPGNPMEDYGYVADVSVSDSSGTLLFFCNGRKVYNRDRVVMPNGSDLLGGECCSQEIAVKDISNPNLYYLFLLGDAFNNDPDSILRYSVIDMQLNGGKGDIVAGMKNIPLTMGDSARVSISATRHQNNRDAWVVALRRGIPVKQYLAYLVDSSGVSHTPVVSVSTLKDTYVDQNTISSFLRISPNGKYLFCTDSLTEMCLFNTTTGVVTPKFRFWAGPGNKGAWSQEFSIDSRYVYFTTPTVPPYGPFGAVVQYDMINTDSSSFMNSRKVIGDGGFNGIQMAPDGKIYVTSGVYSDSLNRINNPSESGSACNYQKRVLDLQGTLHLTSIPQFLQRYKAYLHHSSAQCQNDSIHFSNDIWPPPDSIHWDFGDPASGTANYSNLITPSHLFSGSGSFTVEMWVRHNDKRTDTSWVSVNVLPSPHPLLGNDTTICTAESVTFDAGFCTGCTYRWTNLGSGLVVGTSQTFTTGIAGVYEAVVTDNNDCIGRDTVQLFVDPFMPVSVTISASINPVCTGTPVIFTASAINGGSAPSYAWNVNGIDVGSNNPSYTYIPVNGDCITCQLTSNLPCTSGNPAPSNMICITVNTGLPVSVTVAESQNPVCSGTSVIFTATPVNGGTSPVYLWKVNGINAGTNSPTFTYLPVNGDLVWCILNSSEPCTSNNPASSIQHQMVVNPNLPVSVAVSVSANPVCAGTSVTFTAAPTNGGITPQYQWKVNGANAGPNNPVYTYVPVDGDLVWCILISSEVCTSGNPASSIQHQMVVNDYLPVSVSLSASSNPFCPGSSVTFTATPTNGGTSPQYQWRVNGVNVGTSNAVYTYVPVNGDLVLCVLTSSESCTSGNPASSIQILMVVNNSLPAGVSIVANPNPFCPGTAVNYIGTPVNGGTSPAYQWKVNGSNAGGNSPNFSFSPQPGDSIWCIMTSNLSCVTSNPATSNKIAMVSSPVPSVTFTLCFDSITTVNAKPIKLKGGIPLGGTFSGPGVNPATGIFTPSAAGTGTKTITYSYTNAASCTASKTTAIIVLPAAAFICGSNLTDIRDNKIYPTLQLGSQCWMAANLNYGTMILASSHQRDNCLPEKYCYNDQTGNCELGTANYQWDELMLYTETPGQQGLCPPAWHVPTEVEWNTLFSIWTNNGFAGSPLKYSGYSGFNALMSGVRHLSVQWDYQDVATFFWSSTPYGPNKAWSHGINDYDPSVAAYPASRANAFSIRCLKD